MRPPLLWNATPPEIDAFHHVQTGTTSFTDKCGKGSLYDVVVDVDEYNLLPLYRRAGMTRTQGQKNRAAVIFMT